MTQRPLHLPRRALCATLLASLSIAPALPVRAQAQKPGRTVVAEKVTVRFVNAEIEAVSRAIAAMVKRPILVDPRVKGTMTLYSEQPLSTAEAFQTYLSTLRGLGFAAVEVAGLLKVVPEADAKLQTGSVSVGEVARRGDQIVTQVFRLQHENPNNLVTVLRPLISPNNTINANPGNQTLVVTDYADNLQRIARIIAALDTAGTTDVEVIPVQHTVAADLAQMVSKFIDSSGTGTAAAGSLATGTAGGASVIADARTNALLVRAPTAVRLAQIRAVIDKLDRPASAQNPAGNIHVVYLRNADATKLAAVLRAAYSASGSGSGTGGSTGSAGGSTGMTPASGSLGSTGAGSSAGASTQSTAPVAAAASPSTGGFVQADPATNSLIITAPDPVYRQLRAVIDQLDARRAQVYVESMIVKMDATKAAEYGFQWQGLLSNGSNSTGLYAGTNYSTGSGTNLASATIATTTGSTSGVSVGTGLNIGLIQKIAGVYTLGALARFLESETGANVLSTPNLVTLDNEEAKIVIGQNVPFITGSYTSSTSTSSSSVNPFQTVERKDVGLTLRVKPQIGENGTVRMVIYQENSSVVESTVSNSAGPRTDKSAIETTVVVDDGQMLVLGGLLKDEYTDGEDRVPGLASVPLVGGLFKSAARKRIKTNLLVFLRPVVMRNQGEADQLTLNRYDAIRAAQQDGQPKPSRVTSINEGPQLPENPAAATLVRPAAPSASAPAGTPVSPPAGPATEPAPAR
ncbi:type II secretion system protein D (GspD) [Sphaerotilus hippei]|uniref:Type IV pilus biogenesis and competence protein PilQ n=1 Tax=Sphaerotilus hippei TaxID=744406 RepID=A0A318H1P4_9BURK|nr:type II secretion system secretin GspD [Sphaerotilus hippei]PXW97103.1 type II secretion system protein D (GspD) [Sphaerotilus hippei]